MKKAMLFFSWLLLFSSCKNEVVEKPQKLIDEDKMVNIIYDLTLLEAIKSQNNPTEKKERINPKAYIYKKYKIDSLQFAQSNRYYASEITNYQLMYAKVNQRIGEQQKMADALVKKENAGKPLPTRDRDPDQPQVQ